ncbi:selenium-dependent molybdenum cofactor biosynthesis protein YqeB [Anaerotruncus rubiinfantis]|uniref:selenium-dependent molybdenum cofactor biosynthesis protein YqeB n=1 Tax=Anaerotruncus rubiinfantis TaxID=1720200 RepID=UPI0034A33CCE
MLILIKGAGDLASGVAHRLYRCGFTVVMTEIAKPTTVRRTVAFSRAIYEGEAVVEGVKAQLAHSPEEALAFTRKGVIAVLVDPECACRAKLSPDALVDAILAKRNTGTKISDAPVVVAMGPGFTAGVDCHAVIETKRGHNLGRVIFEGRAAENTGVPGNIGGYTSERIIRACRDGIFTPSAEIGQHVQAGDLVAAVDGEPVTANISGVVRGMLPPATPVHRGMKSGDIDPRGITDYCYTISDKARAIAGGVLEAILHLQSKGERK